MTEKELRKLNRYQLLEVMMMQTERIDTLEKQLQEAQAQLEDRTIRLARLGSVAEAALQLEGVFDAAQRAADLYLDAAKQEAARILEEANRRAEEMIGAAETAAQKGNV